METGGRQGLTYGAQGVGDVDDDSFEVFRRNGCEGEHVGANRVGHDVVEFEVGTGVAFGSIRMPETMQPVRPVVFLMPIVQEVKYVILAFLLLSCMTGFYSKLQGMSPWDVFSMLTTGRLPKSTYIVGTVLLILIMVGMCTQERFFCQFLCPMGAVFAIMPVIPGALFKRNRQNCAPKCTLCKKRCPAHLDIDGDTAHSGECICCHACTAVCPRKNIHTGTVIDKK